ncbi:PP2C family protein-serine/threonine phosphatase [Streptomyces massasporeus]|uniref:PP2C family protein-serine/threonine phosphatase n=1 Tax=Streptomyces massasporeus TaxID=67324 RepID=UPI0037BBC1B6
MGRCPPWQAPQKALVISSGDGGSSASTKDRTGHVPPLPRHARYPAVVLDVEPGPLLGIDTGDDYPVTTVPLLPGTTLALYTDGLVEIPGSDATRATRDLAGHLDTADGHDLERLIDRLVRHTTPTGRHTDDIAVLLLRAFRLRDEPA